MLREIPVALMDFRINHSSGENIMTTRRSRINHNWNAIGGFMNINSSVGQKPSLRTTSSTLKFTTRSIAVTLSAIRLRMTQNKNVRMLARRQGTSSVRILFRIFSPIERSPAGTFRKNKKPDIIQNKGTATLHIPDPINLSMANSDGMELPSVQNMWIYNTINIATADKLRNLSLKY